MENKIKDVRDALNNKTYYCALALALTFPDICCHVENGLSPDKNSDRDKYIDWFNKYVDDGYFHFPIPGFETQTFTGEMCYSLRCKVLHNGNTKVKNKQLGVIVDDFILTFPSDNEDSCGYRYVEEENGNKITYIWIDYLCEVLCNTAESFYNKWENKQDFDGYSF